MSFAFTYFIALFASWLLIPYLIKHSSRLGMVDHPSEARKSHKQPISRAGGLGIIVAAVTALSLSLVDLTSHPLLFAAAAIVVVWGVADDIWQMNSNKKFFGQILAVCVAIYGGVVIEDLPGLDGRTPEWLNYTITLFFLLGVTNAVNMTDGLDGLAAGSTLMSLGLILLLSYSNSAFELVIICVSLMGGISGFLRYNTHPAQVFMGDAGSQCIGFMAAALAILSTQGPNNSYSAALPLLILGLPILDTLYVILIRVLNGNSPFKPDRNHLHHRLIRLDIPHHEAVALVYLAQTALMALAFILRYSNDWLIILSFILYSVALLSLIVLGKRFGWRRKQRRRARYADECQERRNPVFRKLGVSFTTFTGLTSWLIVSALAVTAVSTCIVQYRDNTLGIIGALVTLLLLAAIPVLKKQHSSGLIRLCTGATAAIVFYAASSALDGSSLRYVVDTHLLLLIGALVLCVRLTREYLDILNNQDLLILCVLISLTLLPLEKHSIYLAMRIVTVVYAVEYLQLIRRNSPMTLCYGCVSVLASLSLFMLL